MEEKRFCQYCGGKISLGAKFCGSCGKSLITDSETRKVSQKENEDKNNSELSSNEKDKKSAEEPLVVSSLSEEKASNQKESNDKLEKGKEQASKIAKNVESKIKLVGNNTKEQAKQYKKQFDEKDEASKSKIKKILLGAAIVLISVTGIWWYQGGDYRQSMKAGETYFERGEYGESQKHFKEAHDEKPGNKTALNMLDHAEYLGSVWTNINQGWGDQIIEYACDDIEDKINGIKDKKIKQKYEEALTRIINSSDYKLEQRIRGRLEAVYK